MTINAVADFRAHPPFRIRKVLKENIAASLSILRTQRDQDKSDLIEAVAKTMGEVNSGWWWGDRDFVVDFSLNRKEDPWGTCYDEDIAILKKMMTERWPHRYKMPTAYRTELKKFFNKNCPRRKLLMADIPMPFRSTDFYFAVTEDWPIVAFKLYMENELVRV